jgi:hypothetical protein
MNTQHIIKVGKEYYKTVLNRIRGRGYPWYNTQRGVNDDDGGGGGRKRRKKKRRLDYDTL